MVVLQFPFLQSINLSWSRQRRSSKSDTKVSTDDYFQRELKHLKSLLQDKDTQHHRLPLKFHRHIKPPVRPAKKMFLENQMVGGRMVPFTMTMALRTREKTFQHHPKPATTVDDDVTQLLKRPGTLRPIFETDDYERQRKQVHPMFLHR
ncbi:Aste57867_9253 [Aphanomyces stellatus]|uniref:Aste57867_9253 protein n=1 Tax=Aphanomyces stellatus TaxID=120398 RepID=A0A485KMQ8_9STRA|nr:hypothetical protein As57867_009217 [Aphanomyces stellatus]VFT86136.1 Aste57867_9253 [Aphanomyces stellatus]